MKTQSICQHRAAVCLGGACIALAALTLAPAAHAGSNVYWSIGVTSPGVAVGASNAYPVYAAPAPVYAAPAPVYVQPRPVYVQPQPAYGPPPVYYNYGEPVVVRPPVVVAPPLPAYPIGWAPRGRFHHHHHHHRRDSDWRY